MIYRVLFEAIAYTSRLYRFLSLDLTGESTKRVWMLDKKWMRSVRHTSRKKEAEGGKREGKTNWSTGWERIAVFNKTLWLGKWKDEWAYEQTLFRMQLGWWYCMAKIGWIWSFFHPFFSAFPPLAALH